MNLGKSIPFGDGVKAKFYVQVTNLFDDQWLRLFSGSDLDQYMTRGIKPYNAKSLEPAEWNWYTNEPRQINVGTTVEF